MTHTCFQEHRHTHTHRPLAISWLAVFSLWINTQPWAIIKYYTLLSTLLSPLVLFQILSNQPSYRYAAQPSFLLLSSPCFATPPPLPRVSGCRGRLSPLFPVKQIKMAAVWMGFLSASTFTSKYTQTPSQKPATPCCHQHSVCDSNPEVQFCLMNLR